MFDVGLDWTERLALQLVTVHVSPYPLGFGPLAFPCLYCF